MLSRDTTKCSERAAITPAAHLDLNLLISAQIFQVLLEALWGAAPTRSRLWGLSHSSVPRFSLDAHWQRAKGVSLACAGSYGTRIVFLSGLRSLSVFFSRLCTVLVLP